MQALWSRAARNPGTCRCIQCVSNTTAVARRAGAVNITGPWAFRTPTSTFVYTAIFAAGLAIDGRAKLKRNEQWDSAFNQLREEMDRPSVRVPVEDILVEDESINSNPSVVSLEEIWPKGVDWDLIFRETGMDDLIEDDVLQNRQSEVALEHITEHLWELLRFDSRFPGTQALAWPVNTGPDLIRHHLPPQSLWSLDHMRRTALQRRQTPKKLAIQELSIGILILSLLRYARKFSITQDMLNPLSPVLRDSLGLDTAQIEDLRREMYASIQHLQNLSGDTLDEEVYSIQERMAHIPKPRYRQDNDGDFYNTAQQMNTSIEKIFSVNAERNNDQDIASALTKLCHNLLVSSAGPDVHTFNLLMSGLKRWKLEGNLIEETIKAFEVCKIRPNELTCAIILNHYIRRNQPHRFEMFVAKMRGAANALMLATPKININERGASRLHRVNERKVYQKVHPTPLVFNTLMHGVLKFADLGRALEIYYEMKKNGWGLDVRGLSHFLVHCIRNSDWDSGLCIWEEITSIIPKANPRHMAYAYSHMLSLCSVTGNSAAFNQILKEVVTRGLNRKEILDATMAITQKAHSRQTSNTRNRVPSTPAWTADNIMIAVSSYMENKTPSKSRAPLEPDTLIADALSEFDDIVVDTDTDIPIVEEKPSIVTDSEASWSTWLDLELAGRPQQTPSSTKASVKANVVDKRAEQDRIELQQQNPDAAWSNWLEHELGGRAEQNPTGPETAVTAKQGSSSEEMNLHQPSREKSDEAVGLDPAFSFLQDVSDGKDDAKKMPNTYSTRRRPKNR